MWTIEKLARSFCHIYHKTLWDIQAKTFSSQLLIIPSYYINTLLMGPLQALFSRVSAVCRRIIASNFQARGRVLHPLLYSAHRSRLRLVNIIAIRNVDDVTSVVYRWRRRRRKGRREAMKKVATLRSPFPSGEGSGNLPRRASRKSPRGAVDAAFLCAEDIILLVLPKFHRDQ